MKVDSVCGNCNTTALSRQLTYQPTGAFYKRLGPLFTANGIRKHFIGRFRTHQPLINNRYESSLLR